MHNHKGITIKQPKTCVAFCSTVSTTNKISSLFITNYSKVKLTMAMKRPMKRKYVRWSGLMEEAGLICRQ